MNGGISLLDFKELSKDGQDLELLIREILFSQGLSCYWSGKGPDGGRDLLAVELRPSFIATDQKRWLIQCKHNAHGGASVGIGDLDDIVDSCAQHEAEGYLLVCSTQPSSAVVARLEAITANPKQNIIASFWDAVRIEQILSTPRLWRLAQRFFPASSHASSLQVYATENPNHWVVNFKGYYFHLTNRIGSSGNHHFSSIDNRISEIQAIKLPEKHFIRIRSVYFDDKNGSYKWYLDYMHPFDQDKAIGTEEIKSILGDESVLEDGQIYHFDVMARSYMGFSDHYDPDHYDYYEPYVRDYLYGAARHRALDDYREQAHGRDDLEKRMQDSRRRGFESLRDCFSSVPFIRVVRACNAEIESLDRFNLLRNWSDLIAELELESDRFFSAWFLLETSDDDLFHKLIASLPQGIDQYFRLTRLCVYVPTDDGRARLASDDNVYELTFAVHPSLITNKLVGRERLNGFFDELTKSIGAFLSDR